MFRQLNIGVLALQGDFQKHIDSVCSLGHSAVPVRLPSEIEPMDGIILPGGESTTILKLMDRFGTDVAIKAAHAAGVPIYGTCAGLICISTEIETGSQSREGQTPLALLDATVTRNGFGTQLDSFETDLTIDGLDDGVFRAIFIRAPMISKLGRSVETLAIYNGKPVLVRNGNVLASTFHPELSNDLRIHKYFAQICDQR